MGFAIAAGETYGLLGPNGAGKTTTISMVCGLLGRDAGHVSLQALNASMTTRAGPAQLVKELSVLAAYALALLAGATLLLRRTLTARPG